MVGCKSRLLVIGISVAIFVMSTCKVLECWSNGVMEKNKDWSTLASGQESLRLGESIGVMECRA